MITTKSTPQKKKTYIKVGWNLQQALLKGDSPYIAVNLRKSGLKLIKQNSIKKLLKRTYIPDEIILIDLSPYENSNIFKWWYDFYELIDEKKFLLARIRIGF